MILVRTGPRFLFFKARDKGLLCALLEKECAALTQPFEQAYEQSGENDTILFIIEDEAEREMITESTPVVLVNLGSSMLLLDVINRREVFDTIESAELGPGLLIMKAPPPEEKIVEKVKREYDALSMSLVEAINTGHSNWSVVSFTAAPLSRPVKTSELLETSLLIKRPLPDVYQDLRRQAVKYLTEELEEGVWREIKINIGDSRELFNIHYQRVATVIEDLEIGFILGETWSVDHPFVLLSVPVFQIQLFTYLSPKEVKKIMMSLEYDASGNRVADIDLFYQNRKIEWGGIEKERQKNRIKMGHNFREKYFPTLTAATREKLDQLEQSLVKKSE